MENFWVIVIGIGVIFLLIAVIEPDRKNAEREADEIDREREARDYWKSE